MGMAMLLAVEDPSVESARIGDLSAWAELRERYHPVVVKYLEIVVPTVDPDAQRAKAIAASTTPSSLRFRDDRG